MSAVKRRNLQQLCRACLKSLKNTTAMETMEDCEMSYNLLPNLSHLFVLFTSLDVAKEIEVFPKLLCQLCFTKLMEYDDFRKLTLNNTAKLYDMLNEDKDRNVGIVLADVVEAEVKREIVSEADDDVCVKMEHNNEVDNDDDQLLLPELANIPINIKTEPFFEVTETQLVSSSPFVDEGSENNTQHQSTTNCSDEDDADDEELYLSNGAANTSSPSMYTVEGKPAKYLVLTKRDRNHKRSLHCSMCNKQFYKQIYLDAHVRGIHMGEEKPFQCLTCSQSFTRYNHLYQHKRSQHMEEYQEKLECTIDDMNVPPDNTQVDDKPNIKEVIPRQAELESGDYTCNICLRNYSSKRALLEHLKRHQQIKEHVCKECGVAKVTRTELQTHMRVHIPNLEKFPCPQCPQVFNHKNAISRHVKVVHEGQRRFPCAYCPKRFSTRNSKVCHERLHTGERPFTCEVCHKAFVQQESLRSHMKNHDKTLRKHVCSYCSQRFITLKNLVDHEKRHLGDKPHICNICSKGFYKEEDLHTHRTAHENGGPDRSGKRYNNDFSELEQPTDSGSQSSN